MDNTFNNIYNIKEYNLICLQYQAGINNIQINQYKMKGEIKMEEENKTVETPAQESKGLSIASMVLGIISVVLFCIWYISVPCAILAIVFGIIGKKKGGRGMATAGLVLGIVALAILAVMYILALIGIAGMTSVLSDAVSNITY